MNMNGSVMLVRLMLMPSCAWIDMAMSSDCNNEALMQAPDGGHYVKQAPGGGHYVKACSADIAGHWQCWITTAMQQ